MADCYEILQSVNELFVLETMGSSCISNDAIMSQCHTLLMVEGLGRYRLL